MNNFVLRFVSSIFLFLLLSFLFNKNYIIFGCTIILLLFFALWEFLRLLKFKKTREDSKAKNLYHYFLSREKIAGFDFFIIFCIVLLCFFFLIFEGSNFFYLTSVFFLIFLYWATANICLNFWVHILHSHFNRYEKWIKFYLIITPMLVFGWKLC